MLEFSVILPCVFTLVCVGYTKRQTISIIIVPLASTISCTNGRGWRRQENINSSNENSASLELVITESHQRTERLNNHQTSIIVCAEWHRNVSKLVLFE